MAGLKINHVLGPKGTFQPRSCENGMFISSQIFTNPYRKRLVPARRQCINAYSLYPMIMWSTLLIGIIYTNSAILSVIKGVTGVTLEMHNMSRVMRKQTFCICENKGADQLRGNREADQRLCFRYLDSTISLLPKSEISTL